MTQRFAPTPGYYRPMVSYGGWNIVGSDDKAVAFVPLTPSRELWEVQCNAMLVAGSPEMLEALVRAHNCLNNIPGAHDPAAIARKVQGSIRGRLVKVIGDSERLTSAGIILPGDYEEGPEVFAR